MDILTLHTVVVEDEKGERRECTSQQVQNKVFKSLQLTFLWLCQDLKIRYKFYAISWRVYKLIFAYSQKQWAADGTCKSLFIHLGKILVSVKVAGKENTNSVLPRQTL